MRVRSTAVVMAAGLAVLGAGRGEPRGDSTPAPRTVAIAVPAVDSLDDLSPRQTDPTVTAAVPQVTVTTRPVPRPPTKPLRKPTAADLDRAGVLVAAYRSAAAAAPKGCNLPVALLAAIGQIESGSAGGRTIGADHRVSPGIFGPSLDGGPFAVIRDSDAGRYDGDRQWDRAVGPMQFIPSTWTRSGVDGDGDGRADPQNVYDAAHSAAGYLCAHGRDLSRPADLRAAIWAYNQSADYVAAVLEWATFFTEKGLSSIGPAGFTVHSGGRASTLPPLAASAGASKAAPVTKKAAPAHASVPAPVSTSSSAPTTTRPAPTTTSPTTTSPTTTNWPSPTSGTPTCTPTGNPTTPTDDPTTGTPTTDPTTGTPTTDTPEPGSTCGSTTTTPTSTAPTTTATTTTSAPDTTSTTSTTTTPDSTTTSVEPGASTTTSGP